VSIAGAALCAYPLRMTIVPEDAHPGRRTTSVSLGRDCLADARELGVDAPQGGERGSRGAVAEARAARWLDDNREALDASNKFVEQHGLPLEDLRLF